MRKLLAALLSVAVAVAALAGPASAHVTVSAPDSWAGASGAVTVTVPGELAGRSTVRVELQFPPEPAIADVTVPGKAGWTAEVVEEGGAVRSIVWKGGRIGPKASDRFQFEVATLPAGEIRFLALQEYDNGEVVRWEGADAPTLVVTGGAPTTTAPTSARPAAPTTTTTQADDADEDESGLGATEVVLLALLVAGIGGGLALALLRRRP